MPREHQPSHQQVPSKWHQCLNNALVAAPGCAVHLWQVLQRSQDLAVSGSPRRVIGKSPSSFLIQRQILMSTENKQIHLQVSLGNNLPRKKTKIHLIFFFFNPLSFCMSWE